MIGFTCDSMLIGRRGLAISFGGSAVVVAYLSSCSGDNDCIIHMGGRSYKNIDHNSYNP